MKRFGPPVRRRRQPESITDIPAGERSLASVGLSVRTVNALEKKNIQTVGQLASLTLEQLREIPNFGASTIAECREALKQLEITPAGNWSPPKPVRQKRTS